MTAGIEKTVFISYRRVNKPWALFIYQNLTNNGYDVFIDFQNINSGNFETAILDNIRARAHFIVVLTPSALEECKNPGDWLRREIETALDEKRNIIPLMVEGFDFGSPLIRKSMTGKLATLSQINGLRIPDDYPFEAMDRLRERYLNVGLSDVALPILQGEAREISNAEKIAANEAPPVKEEQLSAQTWYERGYVFQKDENFDEAIRCFNEAIRLQPNFANAYSWRGDSKREKGDLDGALEDHNIAIQLDPTNMGYFGFRGYTRKEMQDFPGAIEDYSEAIRIGPDRAFMYSLRGLAYFENGDLEEAIKDFDIAITSEPTNANRYYYRGEVWEKKKNYLNAITDYQKYLELDGILFDQRDIENKIKKLKGKLTKIRSSKKK